MREHSILSLMPHKSMENNGRFVFKSKVEAKSHTRALAEVLSLREKGSAKTMRKSYYIERKIIRYFIVRRNLRLVLGE